MQFIKNLSVDKKNRLKMWKSRYSKEEYPIKIAENLLYEGLTSSLIWNSNYFSFNGKSIHKYFDDAWNDAYNSTVRSIQTGQILPSLNHMFNESEKNYLEEINFPSFKNRCENCSILTDHDYSKSIEEIEFSYFYYTGAYMCIYAMYALSLMGMNKTEALSEVAGVTLNESDLNHYKTL